MNESGTFPHERVAWWVDDNTVQETELKMFCGYLGLCLWYRKHCLNKDTILPLRIYTNRFHTKINIPSKM